MSEKRIKVLHVITRLDPGGSTSNTLETVARLDRTRYEVDLVAGKTIDDRGEAAEFIRSRGINCIFVDDLVRDIHPVRDWAALGKLRKLIRSGRYDIVHTHSSKAGILGRWAAHFAGVRRIVHTPHGHVFYGYFSPFPSRLFVMAEQMTATVTTALVALTPRGIEEHLRYGVGKAAQWRAIPSGIDMDTFIREIPSRIYCRHRIGANDQDIVFVTVTRLEPIKGNHVLVDAMASLVKAVPQSKLFIVGEGKERTALEAQVKKAGLEKRVVFAGFRKDVVTYFIAADVFVLASLNEGMGRAALEAMVSERPVIVSRTGGLPDLVEDNVQGVLVPPGDSGKLSVAMERLALEPETRRRMGKSAWTRATGQYNVKTMVEKIDALYQEIMS